MIKSLLSRFISQKNSPQKSIKNWLKHEIITRETATMLEGVLNVGNMHVRDIMIPKLRMCTILAETPAEEYLPMVIETGHSRFPLIDPQNDQALGIIMAKDILKHSLANTLADYDLFEISRPVKVIPESKRLNLLLREFRLSHKHMAVVVNEYGNISGLITIEDVLEQIVGDIIDEFDVSENSHIDKIGYNKYEMSALTPIEICNQKLGTNFSTEAFETMGGIVMHNFGRMPERRESVIIDGHNIEIISSDHRRIRQIAITTSDKNPDSTAA